jgi:glycine cleavage system T protein
MHGVLEIQEMVVGKERAVSEMYPLGSLKEVDPHLSDIIHREAERQHRKIILIASESICPPAVREALASEFGHIYAEGYPSPRTFLETRAQLFSFQHQLANFRRYSNRRYYKGCEYVDFLESICRRRTAEVFANDRVKAEEIFVNVQPLSGAAANNAVYNAFAKPGDVVMGGALSHGGHLTHGSSVNRSGMNFKAKSYELSHTGKLDYDAIEKLVLEHKPKLLIGGFSAYPWDVDWERFRKIADRVGAVLLADIAHLAGMVAAGLLNSPVGHAHVVSFTTHKTLCGPRGAMLLSTDPKIAAKLDFGVFPGEQGGPHIHTVAAKAVAMEIAKSEAFKTLQKRVLENAKALVKGFEEEGLELAYGGTNTHLCLVSLRKLKTPNGEPLTGEISSRILDLCGIVCNKNTIAGDTNAVHPTGLRFGTTWVTQRGFTPEHIRKLAALIAKVLKNIHPFSYIGSRVEWGRGKIDPAILDEVSEGVAKLLGDARPTVSKEEAQSGYPHFPTPTRKGARETPLFDFFKSQNIKFKEKDGWLVPANFENAVKEKTALKEGAAILDAGGALLVEVASQRAGNLLECACTGEIQAIPEKHAVATLLADQKGQLLGKALVMRLPMDSDQGQRYWVSIGTEAPDRALRWLRGLSDGYFLQDEDLWAKCEGPAVIEDLAQPCDGREPVTRIGLRGPKVKDLLKKILEISIPAPGEAIGFKKGWLLCRPANTVAGFDVFLSVAEAKVLWKRLQEAGAQPVGCDAVLEVFDSSRENDLQNGPLQKRIQMDKPFFIGQRALRKDTQKSEKSPPPFVWNPKETDVKKTCLYSEHEKLTSSKHIVPFAGWKMPVMYSGILEEHAAVRTGAGLFDVSHMGLLEVSGSMAERFLDLVTANYVPLIAIGQAQYSYLLAHDGRCIDDIIIYRMDRERFMVVVNAANADEDEAWLRAVLARKVLIDPERHDVTVRADCVIRDLKDPSCGKECRVDMALQGPRSFDVLKKLIPSRSFLLDFERMRKFHWVRGEVAGIDTIVSRTGYTGEEIGVELYLHPDLAPKMWNSILEAGKSEGVVPAGLGARDSTRTEAGFPLHGHELAGPNGVTPIEAGYGSFVKLHKPFFIGRARCLEGHRHRDRVIVRFEVDEKGGKVIRPGNPVLEGKKGEYTGVVTSAASTGDRQVGLALISSKHAKKGSKLQILPITESEKSPPASTPLRLKSGDWMSIPRQATVLARFMRPREKPISK